MSFVPYLDTSSSDNTSLLIQAITLQLRNALEANLKASSKPLIGECDAIWTLQQQFEESNRSFQEKTTLQGFFFF